MSARCTGIVSEGGNRDKAGLPPPYRWWSASANCSCPPTAAYHIIGIHPCWRDCNSTEGRKVDRQTRPGNIVYDLHTHILPGVDDGAQTTADALEMARVAAQHGTRVMLATPHCKDVTENWSVPYVRDLLEDMNSRIQDEAIVLTLALGMENHLDLFEEVSSGRALPINGSRYILVEMPLFGRPNYMEDVLFQLQGLTPVLAHPDRAEAFQSDPELLVGFVERGMLSQITAGSIVGHFGPARSAIHQHPSEERSCACHCFRHPLSQRPALSGAPPRCECSGKRRGPGEGSGHGCRHAQGHYRKPSVEIEPPAGVGRSRRRWWQPWRMD